MRKVIAIVLMPKTVLVLLIGFLCFILLGCSEQKTSKPVKTSSAAVTSVDQSKESKMDSPTETKKKADDETAIEAKMLTPNAHQVSGVREAIFSPNGNYLAVQFSNQFTVLPTRNIAKGLAGLPKQKMWGGQIIGYLPSGVLIYANSNGTYSLDPQNQITKQLFTEDISKYGEDLTLKTFVIVSDDLIITGYGNSDMGGKWGNIVKIDIKNKLITEGARVSRFWYAFLSPGSQYILYEHGDESSNDAVLYHIATDKNYEVSDYFNFNKIFPEYKYISEYPISWINKNHFLAEVSLDGTLKDRNMWLVLFDVEKREIIWKKKSPVSVWPSRFRALNEETALFYSTKGLYKLSLKDGDVNKVEGINGFPLALNTKKQTIAFLENKTLYLSNLSGDGKKLLVNIDNWEGQKEYKGMGVRPPEWSPNGDMMVVFGKNQLIIVVLDEKS